MKKLICLFLLVMLVSGCATSLPFHININSINSNELITEKRCIILPALKDVSSEDLQFREYAIYVKRALKNKGYIVVDKPDEANIAIFLGYGIGEPKEHQYSYSLPVYGQTGVSSAQTFGTLTGMGNTATYSGNTIYTPTYGVVGSQTYSGSYITYTRYIIMNAYDLKLFRETKKEKELWKTEITSTGSVGDLRYVFPILMAGAVPYLGENTGQSIRVVSTDNSKEVLKIKGIGSDFLRPLASPNKIGFYQVDYKDEVGGIGILCQISKDERGWLSILLSLKNNSNKDFDFKFSDLKVMFEGRNLYLFTKDEITNMFSKAGNPFKNLEEAIQSSQNSYLENHTIKVGEHYAGLVYTAVPVEFREGSKITVSTPLVDKSLECNFEYKENWMTMEAFKNKFEKHLK